MLYKRKKKKKTNLSIFELESKCDHLEQDEKLIQTPIIKQELCALQHGCIRDHANQFTDLAEKAFSMGTTVAWREKEKLYSLWILNCFTFLPEVSNQWFSDVEMLYSSMPSNSSKLYCMWSHRVANTGENCLLGKLIYWSPLSALSLAPITKHTLLSPHSVFKVWKPHLSF